MSPKKRCFTKMRSRREIWKLFTSIACNNIRRCMPATGREMNNTSREARKPRERSARFTRLKNTRKEFSSTNLSSKPERRSKELILRGIYARKMIWWLKQSL